MADEHSNSLREALSASYDAAVSGTGGEGAVSSDAAAPASSPAATGTADAGKAGRDASGRFAGGGAKEGGTAAEGGKAAPAADAEMPDGYDAAIWAALTPEARATTAGWAGKQRESLAERDARLKGYEPLDKVLTQQRRDLLTAEFGGVDQALERIFQLSDFAGRDPAGFMRFMAQQRGIDLAQLVGQRPAGQPAAQQQSQPSVQQTVHALVEQQLAARDVDRAYTEFMAAPGLEHRQDATIKRTMAGLLTSGAAADYQAAYAMAVQAHPEFGPKLRAAEAAKAAEADAARRAETAKEKANAAVSVTGAPGTARPAAADADPSTIRDALNKAWERQGNARV